MVYGSRFLGGPRKAMFFWNMVANRTLTLVTNILYNSILSDMETCYRSSARRLCATSRCAPNGLTSSREITAKVLKRGHRIYEVPISYNGREWEEGKKITWKDGVIAMGRCSATASRNDGTRIPHPNENPHAPVLLPALVILVGMLLRIALLGVDASASR